MGKLPQEYLELYLAKAAKFRFEPENITTEAGQEQAARYLLTNGFIPLTKDNVALINEEFYIDAKLLPKALEAFVLNRAKAEQREWEADEEDEEEELKILREYIYGVWVKEGKITGAKVVQEREIRVSTTYFSGKMRIPIEPKS